MDNRTQYVVGFLFKTKTGFFKEHYISISLIEKNRPDWQKDKWSGIGGHIENGETPAQAMKREFIEEAGVSIDNWEQYCTVYYSDAIIHFFRAFGDYDIESKTDEKVFWQPMGELNNEFDDKLIPNLHWLIPLALYTDTDMQKVEWTCRDSSKELQSQFNKK